MVDDKTYFQTIKNTDGVAYIIIYFDSHLKREIRKFMNVESYSLGHAVYVKISRDILSND